MTGRAGWYVLTALVMLLPATGRGDPAPADLRTEYANTLLDLSRALLARQISDPADPHVGAIRCSHCDVLHTRAAEAVFPFAVAFRITGDSAYAQASLRAGNWLIARQEADGSWKETPEEWTGTTTDQLLMMVLAVEALGDVLPPADRVRWRGAIGRAADYLAAVMTPAFASINYVATTAASLAATARLFPDAGYASRARTLARQTVAKMDEEGFISGEGGRSHNGKSGVDLGYDMEMSLWGLGYYARCAADSVVGAAVRRSLHNHLTFIYPDGSMDGSWGIRSNKWTMFGGATSDGCQVLFSLYSDEDPRYATAALRNLTFLRSCLTDGLVGYGPHHGAVFDVPPCIYPTFAKAKNLAMAYELESGRFAPGRPIPSDEIGWLKVHPTLDVVQVRTGAFMGTITAYGYEDHAARSKSKYMYRPSGGALSYLWMDGYGAFQASSVTVYSRPEPMHFPDAPGIRSLTPRIEYTDSTGMFTNLFEFDARISAWQEAGMENGAFVVSARGELKDRMWLSGGIGYRLEHRFTDREVRKSVRLVHHDARHAVRIIEPVIDNGALTVVRTGPGTIRIHAGARTIEFAVVHGKAEIRVGIDRERYWAPYPAVRAYPIELIVPAPAPDEFESVVTYRFTVVE